MREYHASGNASVDISRLLMVCAMSVSRWGREREREKERDGTDVIYRYLVKLRVLRFLGWSEREREKERK